MPNNVLPSDLERVAADLYRRLGCETSMKALSLLKAHDYRGLISLEVDPRTYTEPHSYLRAVQSVAFLKKNADIPTGIKKAEVARATWFECEAKCKLTNNRLDRFRFGQAYLYEDASPAEIEIAKFFRDVRKKIESWVGFGPDDSFEGRFGPGATFSDRGKLATVPDKIMSDPTTTRPCLREFIHHWVGTAWASATAERGALPVVVRGNRFTTVPKDATKDRAIAMEPSLNIFYQLGFGRLLRDRLKSNTGWDLNIAEAVHRRVAEDASVTRAFATLDLSNASDTLAKNLVEILLPRRWWECLVALRSPYTLIDGKWVRLEKFSSMGNGFTFELETIVFAALCAVAIERSGLTRVRLGENLFVFGDDIIVPDRTVRAVTAVLQFCGLSLNVKKSFWGETPFRESCGGDYFKGKPVRPIYCKEYPNGPQDWIKMANQLLILGERLGHCGFDLHPRTRLLCLDQIPRHCRALYGPRGLGSESVIWEDDPSKWTVKVVDSIRYVRDRKSVV